MLFGAFQSTAISGLETAINAALKYDPGTLRDLSEIEGQVLVIDCNMPDLSIAVEAQQQQIIIHSKVAPLDGLLLLQANHPIVQA